MGAVVKKNPSAFKPKNLQSICDLLIDGIKLVKKVNELVKWIMNLHADIQKPMTKAVLLSVCKLIEVLKVLQFTFEKQFSSLNQTMVLVTQHLTHKALTILITIKVRIFLDYM